MTDTVKTANDAEPLVVQDRSSALLTVIFLCFSGMSVALMQTLVIPIQSELPRHPEHLGRQRLVGRHDHAPRCRRRDADRRSPR